MKVSAAQMKKVLTGNYSFSQLGLSMMVTRMKGSYAKDPSPQMLQKCTDEVNAFFQKFESIMGQDYEVISKL